MTETEEARSNLSPRMYANTATVPTAQCTARKWSLLMSAAFTWDRRAITLRRLLACCRCWAFQWSTGCATIHLRLIFSLFCCFLSLFCFISFLSLSFPFSFFLFFSLSFFFFFLFLPLPFSSFFVLSPLSLLSALSL